MNQRFDLQDVACKVYSILNDIPESRDNDRILMVNIWMKESEDIKKKDFISLFLEGKLSHPESITRLRRKLQEQHEKLRGGKWNIRHKMQADVVQQLSFFNKWTSKIWNKITE